jgi:hypothetical protein
MKLTRREVAAALGKSIATVRRLEGHVLHPQRDAQGTHWFDAGEVDRLRDDPSRAKRWARSGWLQKRLRTATSEVRHQYPSLPAILAACQTVVMTARRGRFASRDEVIISSDALADLLDAIGETL